MKPKVIDSGMCLCHTEPRGEHGLEGYGLGNVHRFELMEDHKGQYMRVYPGGMFPDYYETCTKTIFHRFFKIQRKRGES